MLGQDRRARAETARRIKDWAVERFGAGDDIWLVTETACAVPGRPPRQTLLALVHPAARLVFRLPMAMNDVGRGDIEALGEAAAALAAEGCC